MAQVPDHQTAMAAWLKAIVESSDDAIISKDLDGIVTSWNAGAERIFGYSSQEMIGQSIRRIIPADRQREEDDVIDHLRRGEKIDHFETVRQRKDGSLVPILLTISPVVDGNGTIVGASKIARDITSQKRLSAIVDSSDDAIVSKTLDGIVTSWNAAAERMFGYSAAEMIGQSIRRIIPSDRQSEEDDVVGHIRRGEKVEHFETIRQRKDGSAVAISLTISPIHDERGLVVGASKIARDITERRAAEAERTRLLALAEQNARITATLNEVGTIVASALDRDTVVQAVIDAATVLTGAQFGAFFYNVVDSYGKASTLHTTSGAQRDVFSALSAPGEAPIFDPAVHGTSSVRSDDLTQAPPGEGDQPFCGVLAGRLPVRSYLSVPVKARSGDVVGGLFFGHADVGRFTVAHQRLAAGVGSWASVALENARLYRTAQDASRLKDEFLATLSHELRTPLNAILGYAQMIRSGVLAAHKHTRAIDTIERNATALTHIVEDVLDVSRIISGKMRLDLQTIELSEVVREAIEAVRPGAEAKGVAIDTTLQRPVHVSGDPPRLQQIIWNLLSNAVKFTSRGGRVEVRLECTASDTELIVSDTGIGIAPEFLPHIFERFRQADAGTTRERGGLGLGLAIARQLAETHGGALRGASGGLDQGSTFTLTLPRLAAVQETAQAINTGSPRRAEEPLRISTLHGIRVLAVDDDADALMMMRDILESSGASVSTAASANAALEALDEVPADVLVSDLAMPAVDGYALIASVRQSADPRIRDLPAVALSAYARPDDRVRALRSGYQLHLPKPIDGPALVAAVLDLSGNASADLDGSGV